MLPHFDLQGGVVLYLAHTAALCAVLSAFGTVVFRVVVAPRAFARMGDGEARAVKRRLLALAQGSTLAAILANGVWLVAQAANMADAHTLAQLCAAVPEVLTGTAFGRVVLVQSVVLTVLLAVVGTHDRAWRQRAGLCLVTLALCLQAGHSHAYSMYDGPSLLLVLDVVHLLGAGAWLGGLVPLLVLIRAAPPRAGAMAARWFSPLGQACIAALVLSAAYQGWVLIASVPGLVGTAYGWTALAKLALFGVLLGFAAVNRYRFAPALLAAQPEDARRVLLRSLVLQTGAALAIVVAATVLSGLPPAMHEQPVWPFAQRFSAAAIDEDPAFRAEVFWAVAALCGAALVVAAAFFVRRWRWAACGVAAIVAWFAVPHLDLLLVPAYPTSFMHSPSGFSAASIVQGRDIYAQHCVACHGADGRGGAIAAGLPVAPADLTAAHLWAHSDGELFWWISHGITTPEGAQAMPGFGAILDDDALWAAIDYIRARNAGVAMHENGHWTHTVQAPGFDAICGDTDIKSTDLRGHFVRLGFVGMAASPPALATTVVAKPQGAAPGQCVAPDDAVKLAYAIVSGLDATHLADEEFLIDDAGWLRAMQPTGAWNDPAMLAAAIAALRAQKVDDDAAPAMKMPM